MQLNELQSVVKKLSRLDQLSLIQFITYELVKKEHSAKIENGKEYPVWSPYDASEAADILLNELKKENIIYDN